MNSVKAAAGFFLAMCGMAAAAATRPTTAPAVDHEQSSADSAAWYQQFNTDYPPAPYNAHSYGRPFGGYQVTVLNPQEILERASCVLQVDDESPQYGQSRIDPSTVASIASSTTVVDDQFLKDVGIPLEQRDRLVVNAYATGMKFVRLEVLIRKGEGAIKATAATDAMNAIVDRVRAAVAQSVEQTRRVSEQRQRDFDQQLQALTAGLASTRDEMRKDRKQIAEAGNMYGDIDNTISNLESQKQNAQMELDRYRAQLKALQPEATTSALMTQWQQIVDARQQELDAAKKKQQPGGGSDSDVTELQAKLNSAKAQLEAAQQQASAVVDTNQGYRMNQVANLQSNIAQAEARLAPIDDQLRKLNDPAMQKILNRLPQLQQEEQRLNMQINNLNSQMQQVPQIGGGDAVTITILGAADGAH